MTPPLLSIIIPVYNKAEYIQSAIDSALSQKGITLEVLVIDDGSTDDLAEKLAKYTHEIVVYRQDNLGVSKARNWGAELAKGKYLMFVDGDDYLEDDGIANECIQKMEQANSEVCIFGYKYLDVHKERFVPTTPYPNRKDNDTNAGHVLYDMIKAGCFPASVCYRVIQKSFYLQNKLKNYSMAEDIEWFVRSSVNAHSISFIDKQVYVYRRGIKNSLSDNLSNSKYQDFIQSISDSVFFLLNCTDGQKKTALLSGLCYEYSILIGNYYRIKQNNQVRKQLKSLSLLLGYDLFPKMVNIKMLYRICGFSITSYMLHLYIVYCSKSRS